MGTTIARKPTILTVTLENEEVYSILRKLCNEILERHKLDTVFECNREINPFRVLKENEGIEALLAFKKIELPEQVATFAKPELSRSAHLNIAQKQLREVFIAAAQLKPGVPNAANQNTSYSVSYSNGLHEVHVRMSITYDDASDFQ